MIKKGAIILLVILFASFASASFTYYNNTIENNYIGGEKIRGNLNLGFLNEPANGLLTTNFNGSIKLLDILKMGGFSEGQDYNCTTLNCMPDYAVSSEATSASVSRESPLTAGFKLNGEMIEVHSAKFTLSSNSAASCEKQIQIDVTDRNESYIQSNKKSQICMPQGCSDYICQVEYRGCFNPNLASYVKAELTTTPYCEKLELNSAPAYYLGARIENGTKSAKLTMELYDKNWNFIKECELPKLSQEKEALGCVVNYTSSIDDSYFACIAANKDTDYKIKVETSGDKCGTYKEGPEPYMKDYDIFAKTVAFETIGSFEINDALYSSMNADNGFAEYINDYLEKKYSRNCSLGCIVPFKIYGIPQQLGFSNAEIRFSKENDPTVYSDSSFYIIERDESGLSSFAPLNLDISKANFIIPLEASANLLNLFLNGQLVLPSAIQLNVTNGFDFELFPKEVLFGVETLFSVITTANITLSKWNFGASTETSNKKIMNYLYPQYSKNYTLEIELTRNDGVKARKSFEIKTGGLNDSAGVLVPKAQNSISKLLNEMKSFSSGVSRQLENKLNFSEINSAIALLKPLLNKNASNVSEYEYTEAIKTLAFSKLPLSIGVKSRMQDAPLLIGYESIDTSIIEQISGEEIAAEKREKAKQNIARWIEKNYNAKLNIETIAYFHPEGQDAALTRFSAELDKKENAGSEEAYFIINYPLGSINFIGNYSEKQIGSAVYIPVSDSMTIEFSIDGEVNAPALGMYLSPSLELVEEETTEFAETPGFSWTRFIIWMIVIIAVFLAIYIAVQEWYKRRYEAYLFKNPDDLYNIINFISNSRRANMGDAEISKKLRGMGWNGEQVVYAMRKFDGKRTGLWEIPLFRFFEKSKMKKEIAKRQGGVVPAIGRKF